MKKRTLDVYNVKPRLTTMPPRYAVGSLGGVPEAWRTGAGPPSDGLHSLWDYLTAISTIKLCLMAISSEQRQTDGAQWFDGGFEYMERVADTIKNYPDLFKGLEITPQDLLTREARIKLLRNIVIKVRAILDQLEGTLYMEEADALLLADVGMKHMDAQLTIADPATASNLMQISDVPLDVWRRRQEANQQQKDLLQRLREGRQGEIDAAVERATAAETINRIRSGQQVTPEEAAGLDDQAPPPAKLPAGNKPRKGRSTPRTQK